MQQWAGGKASRKVKREETAVLSKTLGLPFSFSVPVGGVIVGDFLQSFDQHAAEAIAAVEVHADEFEADFIDASAAE